MLGSAKTNWPLLTLTSWVKGTSPFQCETILLLLTSAKGTFMFCSLGIKVLNNNATYCYDKIFWNLRSKRLHWNKVYWNQNIIKTLSLQTCGICNVGSLFVFVIISVVFQIFHLAPNKLLRPSTLALQEIKDVVGQLFSMWFLQEVTCPIDNLLNVKDKIA